MGLFILQENAAGGGYIIILEAVTPASTLTVNSINGNAITPTVYNLLTLPSAIKQAEIGSDIDFVQVVDAMRQAVVDLGGGDEETGFSLLPTTPINEQYIAATYGIGTPAQRSAVITNPDLLSSYGIVNNAKLQAVGIERAQAVINTGGTVATITEFGILYTITTV